MYRISKRFSVLHRHQKTSALLQHKSVEILLTNFQRNFDSLNSSRSGIRKPLFYIVGITTIGSAGFITYAKYDKKFRQQLDEYIPGSDAFIKLICQEDKSYVDNLKDTISSTSDKIVVNVTKFVGFGEKSEKPKPVKSVLPLLAKSTVPTSEAPTPKQEIKTVVKSVDVKKDDRDRPAVVKKEVHSEKKDAPELEESGNYQKYNIPELERNAVDTVKQAIVAFNNAIVNLKGKSSRNNEYREEVADLVEKSVQGQDFSIWFKIKEKSEKKEKSVETAEEKSEIAMKKIEHLKLLINDPKTDLESNIKVNIEENIKNVLNDLIYTKALFSKEKEYSSMTEKYSKKVEESRQALSKELGVLFPSIIVESDVIISDAELDLFVLYTCQLLNFYKKEILKLETIEKSKLSKIIEQAKAGNPEFIKEMIDLEADKLNRNFVQELMKQEMKLRKEYEQGVKTILRRQAEVHSDHLEELIRLKENEAERKLKQIVNEKVEDMKIRYNKQLARIIGRVKGLDTAMKEKEIAEKQAKRSQHLWNACQSLILSLKSGNNTVSWENQLKPLENEISAISKAAAEEDPLVSVVINSIPNEAISRGVFSELALKDRFINVEKIAFRLAGLSEGFVSIPALFLSYLQSFLLIKIAKPMLPEELANEPFDVSSLNNYDILFRARYWIDRGDFLQTVKYMNLLKGAAKSIANEWINETRILLETQQAANLLLSHAVYSNVIYVQNSS